MAIRWSSSFGNSNNSVQIPSGGAIQDGDIVIVMSGWRGQVSKPQAFSTSVTTDPSGNTYELVFASTASGFWTASWCWVCLNAKTASGFINVGSGATPAHGGNVVVANNVVVVRGATVNTWAASGGVEPTGGNAGADLNVPANAVMFAWSYSASGFGSETVPGADQNQSPYNLTKTLNKAFAEGQGGINNSQWETGYLRLTDSAGVWGVDYTSGSSVDWQLGLLALWEAVPPPPKTIISLSVQPGFFDISDAVLGCDQPLADYDLIKISYNAKLAVCRPEAFFMGYYTDGNTLPVPVSPLDAYAYNLTESLYFFQLDSTKPPLPGFSPGQETSPALDFTGQPVEGFLCDPYQLTPNFGTLTQAGFSTEKQIALKSLFYEHGSVGDNVPQQPYPAGSIAAYCFGQRQSATMAPILPGSSYQTNFQPVFYDFPDAAIFDGAPVTQQMMQAISRNAKLGIFRFEIFFMGYYRNNDIVPTPVGAGNYSYAYNECIFMPMLGSSRQPTGDFVTGQVYFPPLANLDVYQFPANALPEQLFIDPATGQVSCSINGANGPQGQGSVAVYCFAQRYPNLTMAAQPFFVDIPDTDFVGGQVPSASLLQQLNDNAKFGIVATEAFFMGYFENGDIISAPTSPVDNYTYDNFETLYIPVWVSSHKASGLTPGQKTWPAFGPDLWTPSSNTTLVASPYKCFVNQYTAPYGQLTATLYGAGNGITDQGIVAVYAICSRRQNITGTTL